MLVEINLLPRKERGKSTLIVIAGIFLALCFLAASFFYWRMHSLNNQIDSISRMTAQTQQIATREQKSVMAFESTDSVKNLESSIDWAEKYSILSVPVMRHLTALLPERGFIQSFSYDETGTLTLTVQFDTSREAAYFLDRLNRDEWIDDAELSSLLAQEQDSTQENTALSSSPDTSASTNNDYMPRYMGQFEIKLNKEMARKNGTVENDEAVAGEGVSGS